MPPKKKIDTNYKENESIPPPKVAERSRARQFGAQLVQTTNPDLYRLVLNRNIIRAAPLRQTTPRPRNITYAPLLTSRPNPNTPPQIVRTPVEVRPRNPNRRGLPVEGL